MPIDDNADAYTINEFCARNRISRPFLYRLFSAGLGPRVFRLGSRVLITREAAREWRAAREAATVQPNEATSSPEAA
jgi:predicted DNA-binding transcriptional regulator AlpA